jgi:large subunit ribosomal protein L30
MSPTEIEIKLIKSLIGSKSYQKSCVKGLGLSKLGQVVFVKDSAQNRGMINRAKHLLEVKE